MYVILLLLLCFDKHLITTVFFILNLYSRWNVNSGKKFDYYMEFLKKVANITYENLEDVAPYVNNNELTSTDIIDLILKVLLNNLSL